mmetsp:Transcript_20116/g.60216  ORF Transcript_20116/g.60216 Transcript_20116/m.60216 type:complete len:203 (+) Transcript_20116:1319-1927(+)
MCQSRIVQAMTDVSECWKDCKNPRNVSIKFFRSFVMISSERSSRLSRAEPVSVAYALLKWASILSLMPSTNRHNLGNMYLKWALTSARSHSSDASPASSLADLKQAPGTDRTSVFCFGSAKIFPSSTCFLRAWRSVYPARRMDRVALQSLSVCCTAPGMNTVLMLPLWCADRAAYLTAWHQMWGCTSVRPSFFMARSASAAR